MWRIKGLAKSIFLPSEGEMFLSGGFILLDFEEEAFEDTCLQNFAFVSHLLLVAGISFTSVADADFKTHGRQVWRILH